MSVKNSLKKWIRKNVYVRKIIEKINVYSLSVPPGHFYSPIPDVSEISKREDEIFDNFKIVDAIQFNDDRQLELLKLFTEYEKIIPFLDNPGPDFRYNYNNEMYSHSSGALLFCFLHYLKPKRVIEVGSGYSSALMLDVNNKYFNNEMALTFIEPYPARLNKLLRKEDYKSVKIIENKVEEIDLEIFSQLKENDILFIDSTHISKIGSDVNSILFNIIPKLKKGVYIHFHDILYPFEYPKQWIYQGIHWNESYLLRSFLMYNNSFSIQFFNTYLLEKFSEQMKEISLFNKNIGGCLWLKKEN